MEDIKEIVVPEKQIENKRKLPHSAWKPGQSGNPNGRPPKGLALTDVMREMLEKNPEIKQEILKKLLAGAAKGDLAFIKEVLDRIDGKPNVTADIHNTGEVVVVPDEVYKKYGITQDTEASSDK